MARMESRLGMLCSPNDGEVVVYTAGNDISCPCFLEGGAAGLFESLGELEDASFAERGAEDLEADGQVFLGSFAAGDGDAGHAC